MGKTRKIKKGIGRLNRNISKKIGRNKSRLNKVSRRISKKIFRKKVKYGGLNIRRGPGKRSRRRIIGGVGDDGGIGMSGGFIDFILQNKGFQYMILENIYKNHYICFKMSKYIV